MALKLAIVGLGTVGAQILGELMKHKDKGIEITCVSELAETTGKQAARDAHIEIVDLETIIARGDAIDIVFDLTGSTKVRRALRDKFDSSGNHHTVVIPETVSHLVWSLMTNQNLPKPADHHQGY
jgi:predicted dinucleotide-utilizing enzyme